jgi:hypothetical protein
MGWITIPDCYYNLDKGGNAGTQIFWILALSSSGCMANVTLNNNAITASFGSHSLYDLGVRLMGDFHADNAIII